MNHLDPIQHELQSNILISEKKCVQIKTHKVISLMDLHLTQHPEGNVIESASESVSESVRDYGKG